MCDVYYCDWTWWCCTNDVRRDCIIYRNMEKMLLLAWNCHDVDGYASDCIIFIVACRISCIVEGLRPGLYWKSLRAYALAFMENVEGLCSSLYGNYWGLMPWPIWKFVEGLFPDGTTCILHQCQSHYICWIVNIQWSWVVCLIYIVWWVMIIKYVSV